MDKSPGPVLYKIIRYAGIQSICLTECLSTSVQEQLRGNVTAFQYTLHKIYTPKSEKVASSN